MDIRTEISKLLNLENSRVNLSPHIVFVCGGEVDIRVKTNHSLRNMFMNLSGSVDDNAVGFVLAETYKDWNLDYESLADFENDIAHISTLVLVFLESPGALTEFGLFFSNNNLREKLVVVVHDAHHQQESFIKFGLLNPMEKADHNSVLVYELDHSNIDRVDQDEIREVLHDVLEFCRLKDQSRSFNLQNRGHQIFLIYQLIDLFHALTYSEIAEYLKAVGIVYKRKQLKSALYVLERFGLIAFRKRANQLFYFTPENSPNRVDLHFRSNANNRRYDIPTVKIEVMNFYYENSNVDRKHKKRISIIERKKGERA